MEKLPQMARNQVQPQHIIRRGALGRPYFQMMLNRTDGRASTPLRCPDVQMMLNRIDGRASTPLRCPDIQMMLNRTDGRASTPLRCPDIQMMLNRIDGRASTPLRLDWGYGKLKICTKKSPASRGFEVLPEEERGYYLAETNSG
jgi:hypothetical protein